MVRQTYRGKTFWTFPGGSIEPDETPQQAAIREVKEEVGLKRRNRNAIHKLHPQGSVFTRRSNL